MVNTFATVAEHCRLKTPVIAIPFISQASLKDNRGTSPRQLHKTDYVQQHLSTKGHVPEYISATTSPKSSCYDSPTERKMSSQLALWLLLTVLVVVASPFLGPNSRGWR